MNETLDPATVVSASSMRSPDTVMRLARLGAFHQCRLSFMRTLLRRLKREDWQFDRPKFHINELGVGTAVYSAEGPDRTYSLVCFGHDLLPEQRSDRVIADAWDATFALFDGVPSEGDIERLSHNVPLQEAGRVTQRELCLSRANRSARLFDYVVDCLADGKQPDKGKIDAVGYLMRTTAVYGSGKFGAADREVIADRKELAGPFQAEMLTVFLIRAFVLDLVEHMAHARAPKTAAPLDRGLRRRFGVGNSTGLGLAPFIINHPVLLNNWIAAREVALACVRALRSVTPAEIKVFKQMLARARVNADNWKSEHPLQVKKLGSLRADFEKLETHISAQSFDAEKPWDDLYQWAEEHLSFEGQEQLVSLLLEPYGELVDGIVSCMGADESAAFNIDGAMSINQLKEIIEDVYGWALPIDWQQAENQARVWYVSEEKLEPRLGERFQEPVEPYEQPLAPGRDASALYKDIEDWSGENTVAAFVLRHPQHRHMVRRAQITAKYPYAEIRDNTISSALLPIDLLRCKLSFFGATHFDPRSDRWVRINMFKDAPFPNELSDSNADDWSYPLLAES